MKSETHFTDCMDLMKTLPDKSVSLAIVDPPYGMMDMGAQTGGENGILKDRSFKMEYISKWDEAPGDEYFAELFRVSENQIIWGGNYFKLPPTRGIICWDKCQPFWNFSAWEMAWTSFGCVARIFRFDNRTGDKIHPTQKPIKLYSWLLKNYAKKGDTILDTHLGSGSSRIAAHMAGFDFIGCEKNKEYYDAQEKRYREFIIHPTIDSLFPINKLSQPNIFE